MRLKKSQIDEMTFAAMLAGQARADAVIRVPEIRSGLKWWKGAARCHVVAQWHCGDLDVSLVRATTQKTATLLVVAGPGAFEYAETDEGAEPPRDDRTQILDPWGNGITFGEIVA